MMRTLPTSSKQKGVAVGTLVLIRHGITPYNQEKRFTGFVDVSISDQGKEQAAKVGRELKEKGYSFDAAYVSWLKRSAETLEIVLNELDQTDVPVTKHPFLNERHYGDLQGLYHTDMIRDFGAEQVELWRRSYDVRPPNGECLADVVVRTGYYFQTEIMPRLKNGETILVCAHGNSNRSIVKQLEGLSDQEIVKREIAYDEPLIYQFDEAGNVERLQ